MKKEITDIGDIDDIEFDVEETPQPKKKKKNHYVDKAHLQAAFVRYAETCEATFYQFRWKGKVRPPYNDDINNAIILITNNSIRSKYFHRYTNNWSEEMIGDAIEVCVRYAHNYCPYTYNNPFGYLSKLIENAFYNRIDRERTQVYYKCKAYETVGGFYGDVDEDIPKHQIEINNDGYDPVKDSYSEYIHTFETLKREKRERYQAKREENSPPKKLTPKQANNKAFANLFN